jgi:hypothetical protein
MSTRVPITTLLAIQQRAGISHAEAARALGVCISTWNQWRDRGIPTSRIDAAARTLMRYITASLDTALRICDGACLPEPIEPGRYVVRECIAARRCADFAAGRVRGGRTPGARVSAKPLIRLLRQLDVSAVAAARAIGISRQSWLDWRRNGIPSDKASDATAAVIAAHTITAERAADLCATFGAPLPPPIVPGRYAITHCIAARRRAQEAP